MGSIMKWYAVKSSLRSSSSRRRGQQPVRPDDLPYEPVPASPTIDVWALGVLAFELLTGERLLPSNRDDDYTTGCAIHQIYHWNDDDDDTDQDQYYSVAKDRLRSIE